VHFLALTLLAGVNVGPPPATDLAPEGPPSPPPAGVVQPAPAPSAAPVDIAVEYDLPFSSEELALSDALERALSDNMNLAITLADVEVSETSVLSAQGAYDVIITSGITASKQEQTPRGSAFVFSTGSKTLSGYLGVARQLETGGRLDLRFDMSRTLTNQPISFFNPALGSSTLAEYNVSPTLTLTHPLLKGMGVKVNRVPIERAMLATSQSEAQAAITAQNLIRDIVSAYWDLLFAAHDLENKHRAVALGREQLERTRAQVDAGRLASVEVKAVEQSLAQREQDVLIAESTLLDASLNLRTQIGDDFSDHDLLGVSPLTDPDAFDPQPVDIDKEIERALNANPQVQQLRLALASRRLDELEAANQRLVQLDFTGRFAPRGRSVDTAADPTTGTAEQRGSWGEAFRNFINEDVGEDGIFADYTVSGSLDLTWDVQNRGARAGHQRALTEIRNVELNLEQLQQTTTTGVIRAANSLRTAQKRLEVARLSIELAQQNLDAENARFEVGRSTNYDVLQRIDELSNAESSALSARIEYLKARAQLQALTGEILPAYGLKLQSAPQRG
jgi:outer membrane protein TolC